MTAIEAWTWRRIDAAFSHTGNLFAVVLIVKIQASEAARADLAFAFWWTPREITNVFLPSLIDLIIYARAGQRLTRPSPSVLELLAHV